MPIRFSCQCGQQLAAHENHAGLSVRCNACGGTTVVPEPGQDQAGQMGRIRFHCTQCNKSVQVRSGDAGKQVQCPDCGQVLTAPPAAAAEDGGLRPEKRGPRRRFPWWAAALAAGLVLAGLAVWYFYPRGGTSRDFDLVPRDAAGFV